MSNQSANEQSVNTRKLALTAIFAAVAVVGSMFSFPVLGSKCAPVQHMVNVLCAVFLGPAWGLASAFIASLIRNLIGLGTPLAFPGSMCGALLSGLLYQRFKTLPAAWIGEIFGTAVIGDPDRSCGHTGSAQPRDNRPSERRSGMIGRLRVEVE